MTYEEMLEELNHIPMFGKSGGLEHLKKYLALLNHPERNLPVIHVAGTNGKGSVSAFMESVLREAGYKTGLFTSPHLNRINERFRINFEECEDALLVKAWEEVKKVIGQREEHGLLMPTYFEIMFLMGMLVFTWEKPDYCIVETGLGGRLDATVLTEPILCVITSISLDHTALLGDTIPAIAEEKAGIIKEGIPVVYLDEKNGASEPIVRIAKEKKAEVLTVSYGDVTFLENVRNAIDFSLQNRYYRLKYAHIPSSAPYQMVNAAMAMVAVHKLLPELADETMRAGIAQMHWPGRMEEIEPHVYVDGAHNPGAIEQICRMMREKKNSWSLLFAVCADKDYRSMVTMLSEIPWTNIYITKIKTTRGAGVDTVADTFRMHSKTPIHIYQTSKEAYDAAVSALNEGEELLCLGSLYLVGELKEHIVRKKESEDEK
ncbi:MAG: folylpolyglutamate synthase/dihydrofolate synthase family protein [Eubacteriales bacterium]|nr:folylpolyglutamate synthase/dihydrofolate synthase family protein [Eubacteriales bacterium]